MENAYLCTKYSENYDEKYEEIFNALGVCGVCSCCYDKLRRF